ncbi:hypothetical protein TNCT_462461 [Trichonephila clavata]|uniref:Transposase n=1 Tax=Trichonephila clavata TaxID=2740835 RepID=A0A8X6L7I1_TRICU|nr:hypothetical protein TNCT_462461 [Trichonephila clavata]
MLAEDFNVNQSTVVRRLKWLGKVWTIAGWVLHKLSYTNRADYVRSFTELLQKNEQIPFLKDLVTGMSHSFSSKPSQEIKGLHFDRCVSQRNTETFHCKKAMWCVWWDSSGIIYWEVISNGICYWFNDVDERQQ